MNEKERQLLIDLLQAHLVNLQGHRDAIEHIPELAVVAEEGYRLIDEQAALTRRTLTLIEESL